MKNIKFVITAFIMYIGLSSLCAQSGLPYIPLEDDFGGSPVTDMSSFVPTVGDYTLEVEGTAGLPINIAFSNINYTPAESGLVRFVQKEGTVYIS